MIDTDNYEGHTDDFIWTWKQYASDLNPSNHADRALIQDAPLLLAEVKRLREQPKVTIDEWDKVLNSEHEGPYVTMYLEDGREYIGALRLYKDENGKVVE